MVNFSTYYRECFRNDYRRFMSSIPESSRHHEGDKSVATIQFSMLSKEQGHIDAVDPKNIQNFAIALFLTILVDEVMFSHFKPHYPKFQQLTKYPKFIGDCPGACDYHYHPCDVFAGLNSTFRDGTVQRTGNYDFRVAFIEAIPGMKDECHDFIEKHMPEIDRNDFWRRCEAEFQWSR